MRRVILVGPVFRSPREAKKVLNSVKPGSKDILIGIDRGVERCLSGGFRPQIAIGDWDSIRRRSLLARIPHLTLPRDKDRSDLYFAACAALSIRPGVPDELICLGVTGGRPDHHLATLLDLSELASGAKKPIKALDAGSEYHFISEGRGWRGSLKKGETVSLFALNGTARGVSLSGFRFRLKNESLTASSRGLSNIVETASCSIRVKKGRVLLIIPARKL